MEMNDAEKQAYEQAVARMVKKSFAGGW